MLFDDSEVAAVGSRRGFLSCGKLVTVVVLFHAAISVMSSASAGFLDDDFASGRVKTVLVGNEVIDVSKVALPYQTATAGARLEADGAGVKLVLSGAIIGGAGIQADGNFKIELSAGTQSSVYVSEYKTEVGCGMLLGSASYGINVTHSLVITGCGTLLVNNISPPAGLLEEGPEGVRIGRNGWYSGKLTLTGGASLLVSCLNGAGVRMDNGGDISVTFGSLAVGSSGTAVYTSDSFTAKAAMLSLMSSGGHALAANRSVEMEYVYGSFVTRNGSDVVTGGMLSMDQCVCTAIGSAQPCLVGSGCYFGEGEYKIATDGESGNTSAVYANGSLTVEGADIKFCTPNAFGVYLNALSDGENAIHMNGGRIRMVDSVDVNEMFAYNDIAADAYGIATSFGTYLNPAVLYADTIGSFILDYFTAMSFKMKSGFAMYGVRGNGRLDMSAGTVSVGGAQTCGVGMSAIDISGGSLNGTCGVVPVHAGEELRLVSETVVGGIAGAKIKSGWKTALPDYYGIGSLYLDSECKLYFWLPISSFGGGADSDGENVHDDGDKPATEIDCVVTFNPNGGVVSENTRTVVSGESIGPLPTPTRDDCEFLGWYTAVSGGTEVSKDSKISKSVTCYAHWTAKPISAYPELTSVSLNKSQLGISEILSVSYKIANPSSSADSLEDNLDVYIDGALSVGRRIEKMVGVERLSSSIYVYAATMGPGTHTVLVKLRNGKGSFSNSVTVVNDKTADPRMDWAFHKAKSSAPDSLYLGSSLKDMSGRTSFTVGQSIYVDVNFWNAKKVRNLDPVYVQLDLTTGASMFVWWNSLDPGVTGYLTDDVRMPAMLQNLPAGNYTLTATIDPYNNWWETDENNNVKRINFTVVAVSAPDAPARSESCYLYDESQVSVAVGKGEVAPYAVGATVYDGYIVQGGVVKGTIQVKVAKMKNGVAKATATMQLADGSKKITFKNGVADEYGKVTGLTAAGHTLDITLGVDGLGGMFDGMSIDGARNVYSAKDKETKDLVAAIEKQWVGAVNVVGDGIALAVSIAKKGKVKVAGTVNGTKVTATSQLLVGEEACCVPVIITKKANLAFNIWLMDDGSIELAGLEGVVAGKAGTLKSGAKLRIPDGGVAVVSALPGLLDEYLPDGLSVSQSGTKWAVAGGAKAGKIVLMKGSTEVDEAKSKFTDNMSGLKLTYKAKNGSFTGSFKAYAVEKGKLKTYTLNVTGVMIGSVGYGTATLKKPAVSFPITIE